MSGERWPFPQTTYYVVEESDTNKIIVYGKCEAY